MSIPFKEILAAVKKERLIVDREKGRSTYAMRGPERDRLGALLVDYLSQVGVVEDDPTWKVQFRVETKVGPLVVHYDLWFGTIFARFEDPSRSRDVLNSNPHSGKWNFHFDSKTTADEAFRQFHNGLERILPERG